MDELTTCSSRVHGLGLPGRLLHGVAARCSVSCDGVYVDALACTPDHDAGVISGRVMIGGMTGLIRRVVGVASLMFALGLPASPCILVKLTG